MLNANLTKTVTALYSPAGMLPPSPHGTLIKMLKHLELFDSQLFVLLEENMKNVVDTLRVC